MQAEPTHETRSFPETAHQPRFHHEVTKDTKFGQCEIMFRVAKGTDMA
jgi:hypothetical protein